MDIVARDQKTLDTFINEAASPGDTLHICFGTAEEPAVVTRRTCARINVCGASYAKIWDNTVYALDESRVKLYGSGRAYWYDAAMVCQDEENDDYGIKEWKAVVVDGEAIKADTWYTLKDGELVED